MNTQANISTSSKNILAALIAGPLTSKEVAANLDIKLPVVTGSLAGLKKNGFVEVIADGKLTLTVVGLQIVQPVVVEPVVEIVAVEVLPIVEEVIEHRSAIEQLHQPVEDAVIVQPVVITIAKKGDKKVAAAKIVKEMPSASRKDIIKAFKAQLGMSDAQASTYHYNLCGTNGIWKA